MDLCRILVQAGGQDVLGHLQRILQVEGGDQVHEEARDVEDWPVVKVGELGRIQCDRHPHHLQVGSGGEDLLDDEED